jgi:hypothetical protein
LVAMMRFQDAAWTRGEAAPLVSEQDEESG